MVSVRRRPTFWPALLAFAAFFASSAAAENPRSVAPVTERTALDWRTGLAVYGYDPVAYFIDAGPWLGRPEHEYQTEGATWRFRNAGNRAAFIEHPEVYLPLFGAHDPLSIARGVAVPGHPDFWIVHDDRLYLFANAAARTAFKANPAVAATAAEDRWPAVREALTP